MKGKVSYSALILLVILSVVFLIYFSYYFISESRSKIVERDVLFNNFNVDQSVQNIESVLDMLSKDLLLESENHAESKLDKKNLRRIENSLKIHKPYISSVTRTDSDGIILYTVPDNPNLIGNDISYQSHVKKIIAEHNPVFSDVFMAVQGYNAVALHVPIFTDSIYTGSLAYLISFDQLADFFGEKFASSNEKDIHWILSNSGNILFSNNKKEIGKNINDYLSGDHPVKQAFGTFKSGKRYLRLAYEYNEEKYFGTLKKINLSFNESWNVFSAILESSVFEKGGYLPVKLLLLSFLMFGMFLYMIFKLMIMYKGAKDREIKDKLEKNLTASQKLYKSILTDMTSMVCRLNESKKIIFFNRVFYQRFKYKTSKLKGKDIVEILNEDEAIILNSKLDEINSVHPILNFELTIRMNSNEFNYYITARGIFDETGRITEYQVIWPDITEYKLSQKKDTLYKEKIKESEKMAALGNLAAGVAHDFNNILMGIQGNISLLKLKYEKNDEIASRIGLVEEQIKNASGLSRQLLGMAKGGKYEITKFDPNELVRSISEVFSHSNKHIVFKLDLATDDYILEGDKSQIRQAFSNITMNAIQSIKDNGQISIKTEFIDPDDEFLYTHSLKKQKYIKFSVKDNGVGMDEDVKTQIFDPFFTTRKKGKGSGLGLASAYGIVRNHDGALLFESEQYVGSVFSIYLPVRESSGQIQNEQPENKKLRTGSETILVIDDEKMVLNATADMLIYLGYKALKAENGKIALDVFKNNPAISCVIIDMIMPGMDGEKIFSELKKFNPDIKVIISSGYSMSKKVETMLINGAKGFLEKPFSLDELSAKIIEVIESK